MKAVYANPFLGAVANVMQMVAGVEATKGAIKKGKGVTSERPYTLYFTLNNGMEGFFSMSFDEETVLKIVEKMTGMPIKGLDAMGLSALQEMGEMVKGNALTELSMMGIECEASETMFSDAVIIEQDAFVLTMHTDIGDFDNQFFVKKTTN